MAVDPEVQLARIREVGSDFVTERFEFTNASDRTETVGLRLTITPDSFTMEEVKQGFESASKSVIETEIHAGEISWKGAGAETALSTDGAVSTVGDNVVVDWSVVIPAGETKNVLVKISPSTKAVVLAPPCRGLKDRGADLLARSGEGSDL